jgi:hypothetical protein
MSEKDDELLTRIDEVLHYLWDPIGVNDLPAARDEYGSYARVVFGMLKRGASDGEISKYLLDIRVINIGMGRREGSMAEDQVSEIIGNWNVTIFPE